MDLTAVEARDDRPLGAGRNPALGPPDLERGHHPIPLTVSLPGELDPRGETWHAVDPDLELPLGGSVTEVRIGDACGVDTAGQPLWNLPKGSENRVLDPAHHAIDDVPLGAPNLNLGLARLTIWGPLMSVEKDSSQINLLPHPVDGLVGRQMGPVAHLATQGLLQIAAGGG